MPDYDYQIRSQFCMSHRFALPCLYHVSTSLVFARSVPVGWSTLAVCGGRRAMVWTASWRTWACLSCITVTGWCSLTWEPTPSVPRPPSTACPSHTATTSRSRMESESWQTDDTFVRFLPDFRYFATGKIPPLRSGENLIFIEEFLLISDYQYNFRLFWSRLLSYLMDVLVWGIPVVPLGFEDMTFLTKCNSTDFIWKHAEANCSTLIQSN